ncbi:MAG: LysM peptidoglycan-binding domain-containing protein, partial [Solirubrobacterales bacterium]
PDIYGLHLRISAPPANIFAGLELDVSYRKVTDAVGVYQAELKLPSSVRQFDVGAFSFTLPLLALAVYTNGDFEVDIGFPWNFDFSRSFTVQGIVPPAIPVIGAGGFYFGKLSAETAGSHVPATTKGSFNPVIIFGIGLQVGAGKTFQKGPLSAGLTITVLGVVQGVVARWHPNLPSGEPTSPEQLQEQYYFKLQGTLGLAAHMYGSVDFAVIKASVEVNLELRVMITYESYRPIPIEVNASVDVRASLSIDLGLFTIHLHFSFSASISESFTVGSLEQAPWDEGAALAAPAPDLAMRRMRMLTARSELLLAIAEGNDVTLTWSNLQAASTPLALRAYMTPAFTVVGDGATAPAQQSAACVLLAWIESVDPNAAPSAKDTSFEALAKQVLRWTVAAAQSGPVEAGAVDDLVVSDETLGKILALLADPGKPLPIKPADANTFLERNAKIDVGAPGEGSATATYFPMPPQIELKVPRLGIGPYTFEGFHDTYEMAYISFLRDYFSELDVQVEEETPKAPQAEADGTTYSMASIVYAEYFGMVARQMVEAAREGLRDLKLPVPSGEAVEATVAAINAAGDLAKLGPGHLYTVSQLFEANAGHPLNAGKTLRIARPVAAGDTLATIAAAFAGKFSTLELATANKATKGLLLAGTAISFPGKPPYEVKVEDTLEAVATALGVSIAELVEKPGSNLPGASLTTGSALILPPTYTTQEGDTLAAVAARFGVPAAALGLPIAGNGKCTDLFAGGETPQAQFLDVPHLPQYRLGDLIEEAKRSLALQRLSGMLARYFLHGLRLPEQADKSKEAGLFALTGQQLPLGQSAAIEPFDIELSCPDTVSWLELT